MFELRREGWAKGYIGEEGGSVDSGQRGQQVCCKGPEKGLEHGRHVKFRLQCKEPGLEGLAMRGWRWGWRGRWRANHGQWRWHVLSREESDTIRFAVWTDYARVEAKRPGYGSSLVRSWGGTGEVAVEVERWGHTRQRLAITWWHL